MSTEVTLALCLMFGLTTPTVEQKLKDLDSPVFQIRKNAEDYLRIYGTPFTNRISSEEACNCTLDKTKRIESISTSLYGSWSNESLKWFNHKWHSEGELVDFLFGTNWPCIDGFYTWVFTGLECNDIFHSHRLKVGRFNTNKDWPDNKGYEVFCNYYFTTSYPLETLHIRKDLYAKNFDTLNVRWVNFRIATKVWAIDELNKGTDPMVISLILIELRRREALRKPLY